ncbi:MAG: DHH family phosphoesterase [Patescibacteria group bacterium]|nr:DHH family phosphoesterase [Patescibacteria group bacterium]
MKPVLVTCYVNPDLDGVAGAVAYAEFLDKPERSVVAGVIGDIHDEAKYVCDRFNIKRPMAIENADDFDVVILVDSSDLIGLEGRIAPEKVIEIIDHRKIHQAEKFPNAKVQIEFVGAAATLVAEKFMNNEIEISRESAELVCAAIISNTLNFKGNVTTERDKTAFARLNGTARLPDGFWKELFAAKSDLSGSKLIERLEGDFAWFEMGAKKVGIAQLEIIGAKKLINERYEEILQSLEKIKTDINLDFIFLNLIELENARNYFVTHEEGTKMLLEKVLSVRFAGNVAERPDVIMRKQIVPLLKAAFEG